MSNSNRPQLPGQCLIPACSNAAVFRGLCRRCHQGARRAIGAGETTEDELLSKNLILPSARGRRKQTPPWRMEIERVCGSRPAN